MKSFRMSLLMVVAAAVLVPAIVRSQPRGPMSVDDRLKALTEKLTLTKEQAEKVKVILTAAQTKSQALRDSLSGDRDAMRKAMTEQRATVDKKIIELLTAEQKKKYEELQKEREQMMRQRTSGGPGGPPQP